MKKRLFCLALCLVMLAATVLTGCSSKTLDEVQSDFTKSASEKAITLTMWLVSEKEVDAVVSYIKKTNAADGDEYSDDVMRQIEAEAAMCGAKKGGGGAAAASAGGDESDPLMDQALEVAFESGKISTSLLQRRLSVGYGRAAKIIDKMEQLGYVSAPDGQKPRELRITKQEYMELCAKGGVEDEE